MTNRISVGALWDESIAFVRAEYSLLMPVGALGFGLPLVMMLLAVPVDQAETGRLVPGLWLLWFVPAGLLSLFGSLALSAMTLRRGATVAECIRLAFRRLPSAFGLILLHLGFQAVLGLPVAALARIDMATRGQPGLLAALGNFAVLAVLIWLFVRLMPIWALLADRGGHPIDTLRQAFAVTRGRYRHLLLIRVTGAVAGVVALLVLLIPLGAVCALIGAATGASAVAATISYVLTGAIFAALLTLWTVYVALLYRRLANRGM
ncbi:hypothetical protein [Sphingomonas morindae]|uniref:Glycerophosphoryl diester phosphodiesterase membrane domain-containing protein n=1 Tax=Sphingomonas morindae TaxID=1541170 RepID=A0ABY4X5U8_9SPHN|nr:hypothetical protein [Sphingomonas morindae]USI72251.1 hypothetical protein LHA26_13240 [Sphingomonas morindae]